MVGIDRKWFDLDIDVFLI